MRDEWNDGYSAIVTCFTNTIKNRDGDTHLAGFRQALTRTINNYANEYKQAKSGLSGEELREGPSAVVSINVGDPKYSNQAKDKLVPSQVATAVSTERVVPARGRHHRRYRRRRSRDDSRATQGLDPPDRRHRRSPR